MFAALFMFISCSTMCEYCPPYSHFICIWISFRDL